MEWCNKYRLKLTYFHSDSPATSILYCAKIFKAPRKYLSFIFMLLAYSTSHYMNWWNGYIIWQCPHKCAYAHLIFPNHSEKINYNLFTYLYRSGFHPSFKIISAFACSFPSLWSDSTELELDDEAPNKPALEIVSFCSGGFSFAEQL